MKKTIHVHVIEQPARTRDSDEGEGRWVTIMGAHVHIGKGGKIDKGPAALTGMSENGAHAHGHLNKGNEHKATAAGKGEAHADTPHHTRAASAHYAAAQEYGNADHHADAGDVKAARTAANKAAGHASTAEKHEGSLGGKGKDNKPFEMPASHQGLHSDAGDDVKGSEKHAAEHNRLLNLYHTSKADWERNAVNRQIQNNATAAVQHRAQGLHHMATSASERAKRTEALADHAIAMQHITNAIDAHGKAGGVGYAAKQKELHALHKEHAKHVEKADKAQKGKVGADGPMSVKAHEEHAADHRHTASKLRAGGDAEGAKRHDDAADLHKVASHKLTTQGAAGASHSQSAQEATRALGGTGRKFGGTNANSPDRKRGKPSGGGGGSGLDEIAKRAAKRAAESAADQDPKHKQ